MTFLIAIMNSSQKGYGGFGNSKQLLNVELDVEKRLQADVLKDRIRIKQFFIDFDRLRKGYVGEAGVSSPISHLNQFPMIPFYLIVPNMPRYSQL